VSDVLIALIWAGAITIITVAAMIYFGRPLRRALDAKADQYLVLKGNRELEIEALRLELAERSHELMLRQGTLDTETAATKAKLEAEIADHKAAVAAAQATIDDAIAAKQQVIRARAEAGARLAEEFVRDSSAQDLHSESMQKTYLRVCEWYFRQGREVPTYADWIGSEEE